MKLRFFLEGMKSSVSCFPPTVCACNYEIKPFWFVFLGIGKGLYDA